MNNKEGKIVGKTQLTITLILILLVSISGTTYAYFAMTDSNNNTITGNMATVDLTLDVTRVYPEENATTTGVMIPQLSSDAALDSALKGKCVDANTNVACQVYKVVIENKGGSATEVVDGYVYFYSDSYLTRDISTEMPNLKWRLVSSVNESNPNSSILGSNVNNIAGSSGNSKFVSNLSLETNSKFTYYLMVWIDEINEDQPLDESKSFYGKIDIDSSNGSGVTAVFGDTKSSIDNTEYTVTFDPNGGTVSTSSKKVNLNQKYGTLPTPTREGYKFIGWNGKNLFNKNKVVQTEYSTVSTTDTGFTYVRTSSSTNNLFVASADLDLKPNTTYTFIINSSNINSMSIYVYSDKLWGNRLVYGYGTKKNNYGMNTFTTNSTGHAVFGFYAISQSQGSTGEISYIMVIEGNKTYDEMVKYEPYYVTSSTKVTQAKNHILTAIWEEN